ncbi:MULTISPECIES: hypothetical protein [Moorena]|uniref:hypothetical protein n=1 Tax=Moorena TaxID=1155738 RepID=UPI0012B64765|nr:MULTISPECIES: hypothetical protein [Moorena]NEQ15975.1 hypothetical protein [Moorena sp. SIO3E2]NES44859.1 hypothetical protein [Moorena sp. SIO2C4]
MSCPNCPGDCYITRSHYTSRAGSTVPTLAISADPLEVAEGDRFDWWLVGAKGC